MTNHRTFALLAAAGLASMSHAQTTTFRPLGFLGSPARLSEAAAISGDGRVAVGGSVIVGGFSPLYAAFRSVDGAAMEPMYQVGGVSIRAWGVSRNGDTIVGSADHGPFSPQGVQAFVWTLSGGPVLIGDMEGGPSLVPRAFARAVSDDGLIVAGIGESVRGTEGFRYDVAAGMFTPLGDLPGGTFASYAYAISGDGGTIVGISQSADGQQAFRWTRDTGIVAMGFLSTAPGVDKYSVAESVNTDGSVIVGESRSRPNENGQEAFRWTRQGGMQGLGDLPGAAFQSWAYGVSGDGSIVVGRGSIPGPCGPFGCGSAGRPFIWDATHGMRDLHQLLLDLGVPLMGWTLTEARGVSRDGRTIVGTGFNPAGEIEAWVVTLPSARCPADLDDGSGTGTPDGGVTIDDLLYFLALYADGDSRADLDNGTNTGTPDGGVTIDDLLYFVARYEGGC